MKLSLTHFSLCKFSSLLLNHNFNFRTWVQIPLKQLIFIFLSLFICFMGRNAFFQIIKKNPTQPSLPKFEKTSQYSSLVSNDSGWKDLQLHIFVVLNCSIIWHILRKGLLILKHSVALYYILVIILYCII